MSYGWICPKCGGVYSPTVQTCWVCTPKPEATCNTEVHDLTQKCQQCGKPVAITAGQSFGILCNVCAELQKPFYTMFTSQVT